MRTRIIFLGLALLFLAASAWAVQVRETDVLAYNGYAYERLAKGQLLSKMVVEQEFLSYSNAATGVVILAAASAPDNSNILTPYDWYWGTTLVGGGTVKLSNGKNGTCLLDTAHGAQNDAATLTWRETNFEIAKNPRIEALVQLSNLTNCVFEAGWYVDGNDECLFRFSSAVDASHWQIVYENNNGGEQTYDTAKVASTTAYTYLRLDLLSTGGVKCYINGVLVKTYAASTVRDVAFKPRFYAKVTDAGHAATKTLTLDWLRLVQDR